MRTTKTTVVETKTTDVACDLCGKPVVLDSRYTGMQCAICKRDVCAECRHEEYDLGGDYPTVYCKECWEIMQPTEQIVGFLEDLIDTVRENSRAKCVREANRERIGGES